MVVLLEAYHNKHFAEGIISVACWLVVLLIAWRNFKKSDQRNRHFNFPYIEILVATYAFLWAVEGIMIGTSYLLDKYVALCRLCMAASMIGGFSSWVMSKMTEHSLTEGALHWAKDVVQSRLT